MGVENKHRIRLHNGISSTKQTIIVRKYVKLEFFVLSESVNCIEENTERLHLQCILHAACNERAPNELYHSTYRISFVKGN